MHDKSKCPCPGKEYSYYREVSRDWQVSGHPLFSYLWSFPTSFAGEENFVFFHFSLYPSLIAMDRSLQSDLAMVFKVAYTSCLLLNCFLSQQLHRDPHYCGELEQNGVTY